ncbi:major capsid protein [Pseudescherichia vulneris]
MALTQTDIQIFNQFAYNGITELLREQVNLFNAATQGAITLTTNMRVGDKSDDVQFSLINGLIRDRDVYDNDGDAGTTTIGNRSDTRIKVAAGTPNFIVPDALLTWIGRDSAEAGVAYAQQMTPQIMKDYLHRGLNAFIGAVLNRPDMIITTADDSGQVTLQEFVTGSSKFGDQFGDLRCIVMHSTPWHNLVGKNLSNQERLFKYGDVLIYVDPMGRPMIITDNPALYDSSTGTYRTGMLSTNAISIEDSGDFRQNVQTSNGKNNIQDTIQSQWSMSIGVRGYGWKGPLNQSTPTKGALLDKSNWELTASQINDTAGVLLQGTGTVAPIEGVRVQVSEPNPDNAFAPQTDTGLLPEADTGTQELQPVVEVQQSTTEAQSVQETKQDKKK